MSVFENIGVLSSPHLIKFLLTYEEFMPLHVHKNIASLVPYSPGKPLDELERDLGISNAVKLASNENSLGPSPKAKAVLSEHVGQLNVYPDGGAHYLRRALAERWKVDPAQIVVGNGSDEVISLLVKAFVAPGDEAVMADDTFVMYKLAVQGGHGVPVEVPLNNWRHDLPSMARAITDNTRLVFICNPNNPTGTMVSKGEVEAFLGEVPDHVIVVFDEAYYEYVRSTEYPDSLHYVKQNRPVGRVTNLFQDLRFSGITSRVWSFNLGNTGLCQSGATTL